MRTESLTWRVVRAVSLVAFGIFFLVPLLSMVDFSTRVINGGGRTLTPWANLFRDEMLRTSIIFSLLLALLTTLLMLVLLVPTMIWVRLRVPAASKLVEYLCLLPLTIPPLVIVVGIANVYAWVSYLFGNSPLTLTFAYVILVLPYAYRSIDSALASINVVTLAEAARSLGAGWTTVIVRVVLPNIWAGVISAAFVSVALVLGEFTFASLLNFQTMPYVIGLLGKSDAPTSVAASLAALLFASLLLVLLSFVGRRTRTSKGA
ncbi:ABC transporter permease subunit [Nocardioides panacis]|uniref:ABC transporter permease subunit n=1 Tax=Nocardioides panacis TaxID=2849501 RepID=A0A975SYP6_9ACTN|nr:ABC transporter permease subunit [Nocardioides panacis]QWZ08428.1 ABC transporter permease subunit [Nocardioides panacis]